MKKPSKKESKKEKNPADFKLVAEFRRDPVSSEWSLISSARAFRPSFGGAASAGKPAKKGPVKECPFEDPQKSGNGDPLFWLPKTCNGKNTNCEKFENWFVQVIQNKYPMVFNNRTTTCKHEGPYKTCDGFGFHEVVITRDHNKPLQNMKIEEIVQVLRTYQQRYRVLEKDPRIEFILIYHNQGVLAGASIAHPHSQIAALPIVPPDIARSINGGLLYFEKERKCVHCEVIKYERKEKKRIIFENEDFIAFTPYASKVPYEIRIFPKKHNSDFEEFPEKCLPHLAEALKDSLARLGAVLGEFDYNFFIHTSSARVDNVPYYHWHIEIYPHIYKWAGLELGSGVQVLPIPPEQAAENLRNAKIKKTGKI